MLDMSRVFWSVFLVAHLASIAMTTPLDPVSVRKGGLSLSPFVRHWEAARYSRRTGGGPERRGRERRRVQLPASTPSIRIAFKAHNREFNLRLKPDPGSVFAEGAEFHNTRGPLAYDTGQVYSGKLEDDDTSIVYGIITSDGLFDGTIITKFEEYYVEPISRYDLEHPHIHSVIYKESDVLHPNRNSSVPCISHVLHVALNNKHRGSIFKLKNQGIIGEDMYNVIDVDSDINSVKLDRVKRWLPEEEGDSSSTSDTYNVMQEDEPRRNPELPLDLDVPYTRNVDAASKGDYEKISSTRKPKSKTGIENLVFKNRGIIVNTFDSNSTTDSPNSSRPKPKNHVEIIKSNSGVNLNVIKKDVVNKKPVGFTVISALPSNINDSALRHVNKRATVDPKKTTCMLYLQADHMFYQRYGSEEACIEVMTRHVQKVNAIYRVTDFNQDGAADNITFMIKRIKVHTLDALKDPHYRFPGNYGVEKYLELFSEEDYDAFCLAYMFTYRDFEMGTLGLAWTGDLKNAGGVCEKNGHYRGSLKSLNTGIVTLLNYGKHVPPAVSHVTLAHEIGHNFGSPHDPEVCTPGGEDGNFIMFARATSGDKKNNNRFSPCSLRSIDPVLNTKARSAKGCFTEAQASICGNGVVEAGEQCDCGWAGECADSCCRPQRTRPPPGYQPCTLTPGSLCSPSQGPCCTSQCTLKFGERCREDNGCRDASHCDGRRAACPPSRHKPNRTRCDKEFVCYMGECTGSICLAYGLESCQCIAGAGDSATKACELCCRTPGTGPCRSSFQWNRAPYDVPDMHAKPGTPCNDYNGYCDVFQKCREVDPSGPLATLRRLLLSEESMASFRRWILDHWYAVLLIILAIIALLMLSTRWLGRSADPKLKSVTIIHSSTTETVRLPDHGPEGVIVHTAVRSKVPLKKKVMLKTSAGRHKGRVNTHDSTTNPENERTKIKDSTSKTTADLSKSKKTTPTKQKSKSNNRKKGKVKKEVIDYSSLQKETPVPQPDNDALSKVQKWLLSSPPPPTTTAIPKSKSTPVGLAERAHKPKLPTVLAKKGARPSKSANNLNSNDKDKARLQVIYKPPFKFSLKLCKGDKTKVVLDKSAHARARPDVTKRKNDPVTKSHSPPNASNIPRIDTTAENSTVNIPQPVPKKTEITLKGSKKFNETDQGYVNILSRSSIKKSNSLGQGKNGGESRQSLISQDQLTSPTDIHLYENTLAVKEAYIPKSCSMPRRNNSHGISKNVISRQSSYSHLPRAQMRPQKCNSLVKQNNTSANDLHMQSLYSSLNTLHRNLSQNEVNQLNKGSSLNNINNGVGPGVPRSRYSMPGEICNVSKRSRQNSTGEKSKPSRRWSGLDRQLSDDSSVPGKRMELCMPKSAGADPSNVNLTGFQWNVLGKRLCVDSPENRNLENAECAKVNSAVPNSSVGNRVSPSPQTVSKDSCHKVRQQTSRGSEGWPQTFGDLKNVLPDTNGDLNTSDMEVLLSDEEFLNKANI